MERRETVNYPDENRAYGSSAGVAGRSWAARKPPTSRGQPCLYLGPAGQRCNQAALAGGFCLKHGRAGAAERPDSSSGRKRAIAVLLTAGALWPILADFIRELLRLLK